MALTGIRTYVGFGLGPIQAGLFLYEAFVSGAFGRLVQAIPQAEEVGTAITSVSHHVLPGSESMHRVLAAGLRKKISVGGPRAVVYTTENHNQAAKILEASVFDEIPPKERAPVRSRVPFLSTVIGKMRWVVSDSQEIQRFGIATLTPEILRLFWSRPSTVS